MRAFPIVFGGLCLLTPGGTRAQSVSFGASGGASAFTHDDLDGEDTGTTLGIIRWTSSSRPL